VNQSVAGIPPTWDFGVPAALGMTDRFEMAIVDKSNRKRPLEMTGLAM
jgi:hypothetical protein